MTLDELVHGHANGWLRGDQLQVVVPIGQLSRERYRVRGLDEEGHPRAENMFSRAVDRVSSAVDDYNENGYVAVAGPDPRCTAVVVYRAARYEHTWLTITTHRIAVLRLRDTTHDEDTLAQVTSEVAQPGLGNLVRGVGRLLKTGAKELAASVRRSPLAERPGDAVLEIPFEAPRHVLRGVTRWKQPMVPEFDGGPRHTRVDFADESWTRLETDETGLRALGIA
ncbi:hypothetical protein [Actinokineospora enzanensis]|uniref:hypothetical protein n=1 Tax=Actinokineospora enzanensis TaxID=155975 RepID=UPI00035F0345|nr:hypothetical protein [Actinokineospora enzanensis]